MKTSQVPTLIQGRNLRIRKVVPADAGALQEGVSRPEIVRWTTRIPHPYPIGGALRFIRRAIHGWGRGQAFTFSIVPNSGSRPEGVISLSSVSTVHGCAELGYWVGVESWGMGYATEAVGLSLVFAFGHLGLHRVYASTFEGNVASRRVLEKNGFQLEGVLREAVFRHGQRQNYLNYGILVREFQARIG